MIDKEGLVKLPGLFCWQESNRCDNYYANPATRVKLLPCPTVQVVTVPALSNRSRYREGAVFPIRRGSDATAIGFAGLRRKPVQIWLDAIKECY